MTASQIITQSCSSGIAKEKSQVPLLVLIAQLNSTRSLVPTAPPTPPVGAVYGTILSMASGGQITSATSTGWYAVLDKNGVTTVHGNYTSKSLNPSLLPAYFWSSNAAGAPSGDLTWLVNCINVSSVNILSLIKLTNLDLSSNPITSLNLTGLNLIQNLTIHDSFISTLTLTGCTGITSFDCQGCPLPSVNLLGCPALNYVNIVGCPMASLDVHGLTSLATIWCSNTPALDTLNISGCTGLVTLNCYDTGLNSLNVSGFTALHTLNCYSTAIVTLNISGCIDLFNLNCNENVFMTTLTTGSNFTMYEFYLNNCYSLGSVNLSSMSSLNTLSIAGTGLGTASFLEAVPASIVYLAANGSGFSGDVDLTTKVNLHDLYLNDNPGVGFVDITGLPALTNIYLTNTSMGTAELDSFLIQLYDNSSAHGSYSGFLDITGTSFFSTGGAAESAYNGLISNGWTIYYP